MLAFWIGPLDADGAPEPHRPQLWFSADPAFDAEIDRRFGALCAQALNGGCDAWRDHAGDWLALLIVLDQFPRNLHRGSARAFAGDAKAQDLAIEGLSCGFDASLPVGARGLSYLPFQHAENLLLQRRSVALYEDLLARAPVSMRADCQEQLRYARAHCEVIERFGRFPHRNDALGRATTVQERAFLDRHGRGF
ncbi:MAG TPA: DUF924 family protein [Xanthomonadaceae bacterium]|nr:DUF924 family protein [Xanthomonadaceae bacterium]